MKHLSFAGAVVVLAAALAGCSASTDVSKAQNDAYHSHDAGPRPPAGAAHGGPPTGAPPAPGKS